MSNWKDPVGPERKGVYVRRRLIVLIGLLALVAFIVLIIVKPGSSGGVAMAPDVKLPDEITAAEKPTPSTEMPTCGSGELVVTPITDGDSYAGDEQPGLSLRIESIADEDCQADLGTKGMVFTITSGADEVWRSTDCQTDADSRKVILEPGKALETEAIVWDRTRSNPDTCDESRPSVGGGGATYHLHAEIAGVRGESTARFLLY